MIASEHTNRRIMDTVYKYRLTVAMLSTRTLQNKKTVYKKKQQFC